MATHQQIELASRPAGSPHALDQVVNISASDCRLLNMLNSQCLVDMSSPITIYYNKTTSPAAYSYTH